MKTSKIEALLAQGVTTLARRPRHADGELELIKVSKLDRGYVIGTSMSGNRRRWAVATVEQVETAAAKIKEWREKDALTTRARRAAAQLEAELRAQLEELEIGLAECGGPGGDCMVAVTLSLRELRKLAVLASRASS